MRAPRVLAHALAAGALLAAAAPVVAAQQIEKPRLEPARVLGETVVGGYAGIGGFLIGRYATERTAVLLGAENETTIDRAGLAGGAVVGGLATAGTVYAIGTMGNQDGDLKATFIGTGVGLVVALGVARAVLGPAERPRQGISTAGRWAITNVTAMLPAIGGTIGFNSTRRYDR